MSAYVVPQLPNIDTLRDVKMQVPLRVFTKELSLIAEFGEKRRAPMAIEEVNPQLIQAFLAAEDDRFYVHPGVDWQGLVRAAYSLLKTGSKKQGGSTITMQVARNFFLSREKTYLRKLNEIFLALKIERELSKDEILELYLNKIYLGQRAYGIAAAAYVYYGTDVNSLNLAQVAMIAGLPKAPSTTNPISNAERAIIRREYVLQRMLTLNYISDEEYKQASTSPVSATLHSALVEIEAPYVAEMVRSDLVKEYGDDAYNSGLIVTTTIANNNQIAANQALRKTLLDYDLRHGYRGPEHSIGVDAMPDDLEKKELLESFSSVADLYPALVTQVNEQSILAYTTSIGEIEINWDGLKWARKYISENRRGGEPINADEILSKGDIIRLQEMDDGQWRLTQIPEVEGALVSLEPDNGALLALVGGFDFYKNKFNRATQARRQPGSGFKPFIYSAGIAAGKSAASIINDAPIVFDDPGVEDEWRPENYSKKSFGPTRLRVALTKSRNLVSIRLLHEIGVGFALEHIKKFGFDIERLSGNLSLALGSAELTPWELAKGYSVFANGGHMIEPYYVENINTYADEIVYEHKVKSVCRICPEEEDINNESTNIENNNLLDNGFDSDSIEIDEQSNVIAEEDSDSADLLLTDNTEEEPEYAPRVVSARNIWITNSITRDVIKLGTGRRALSLGRNDLSGKTGTTNDQHDAWFAGFNSNVVTICWVGFDDFTPLGSRETGARAALPMWIDYMKVALQDLPETIMERPEGLVNVRINPETGSLANASDPNAIFEVFRAENAPQQSEITTQPEILLTDPESDSTPSQLF
ncbi:MAG: penicillin-binding protein 1A [Pseudomonadota bacterium]